MAKKESTASDQTKAPPVDTELLLLKQAAILQRIQMIADREYRHGDEESCGRAMPAIEALAQSAENILDPIFASFDRRDDGRAQEVSHG